MEVDLLSRIQFAITAGFHFLFPPISIGLGVFLVLVEAMWLKTGDEKYKQAAKIFTKLFAVIFAVGVVTGIVLEFEFGTNWPIYSNFVGDVFGSPLAIEAVFAFFLESVFLGVVVWGWDKIGKKKHFVATLLVCIGAHLSAVWIIAANSFMQTPDGFVLEYKNPATAANWTIATNSFMPTPDGKNPSTGAVEILPENTVPTIEQIANTRAVISDFWDMALNASTLDRLFHTVAGAWVCGAFFVLGICGWLILKNKTNFAKPCAKLALIFSVVGVLATMFTGHESAKLLATTQPEKLAAFEGHFNTEENAPLYVIGWVDEEARQTYGLKVDGFFSLLAFGSLDKEVKGLKELPSDDFLRKIYPNATKEKLAEVRPSYWAPVNFCFQSFRIMVYLGSAMVVFVLLGLFLWGRGKLFSTDSKLTNWYWKFAMFSLILPMLACQIGWAAAEVGRQPWIVWHILKTSHAVTTVATAGEILASIIMFTAIFLLIASFAIFVLLKKIKNVAEE